MQRLEDNVVESVLSPTICRLWGLNQFTRSVCQASLPTESSRQLHFTPVSKEDAQMKCHRAQTKVCLQFFIFIFLTSKRFPLPIICPWGWANSSDGKLFVVQM